MNVDDMERDLEEMGAKASGTLEDLGLEAWNMDREISEMEEALSERKKALKRHLEVLIPEAMMEQGVPEFGLTTPDGGSARLSVGVRVVGSLRYADDMESAVAYLEASGFEGGVKSVVSVDYTEDERADAERFMEGIQASTGKFPHMERQLNPQTLAAFARAKLKEDPNWDYKRVGLKALTAAKFTKRS